MAEGACPALSPGGAVEGAGPRGSPLVFLSPKPWGSWQTACPRLGQRWQSAQHEASHQDKPGLLAQPATLPGGDSATRPATCSSRHRETGGAAPRGPQFPH